MAEVCHAARLVNFANPAGMLAEAATRCGGWARTVGICDSPQEVSRLAARLLRLPAGEIFLDYFGLNHLGWTRAVVHAGDDYLPQLIEKLGETGQMPGVPFDYRLLKSLGMIPNEYLYYYYNSHQAVQHILDSGGSRGEQVAALNRQLFAELKGRHAAGDLAGMRAVYEAYLRERGESYMARETGRGASAVDEAAANGAGDGGGPESGAANKGHGTAGSTVAGSIDNPVVDDPIQSEGYAGVALDLIEALSGALPRQMLLNVPNRGAIQGLPDDAVVEVPAFVSKGLVRPLAAGAVPDACLGLMSEVKHYERLTIAAATEGSYALAQQALAAHPLLRDNKLAGNILDEYCARHGDAFPRLR
jgi:6-phospho-beta-glucosidase